MRMVKLTHSAWVDDTGAPVKIYADADLIAFAFYLPAQKATAVVASGGGHVTVLESAEEVFKLKKEANASLTTKE